MERLVGNYAPKTGSKRGDQYNEPPATAGLFLQQNPLGVIVNPCYYCQNNCKDPDPVKDFIPDFPEDTAQLLAALTRGITEFGHATENPNACAHTPTQKKLEEVGDQLRGPWIGLKIDYNAAVTDLRARFAGEHATGGWQSLLLYPFGSSAQCVCVMNCCCLSKADKALHLALEIVMKDVVAKHEAEFRDKGEELTWRKATAAKPVEEKKLCCGIFAYRYGNQPTCRFFYSSEFHY